MSQAASQATAISGGTATIGGIADNSLPKWVWAVLAVSGAAVLIFLFRKN